MVGYAIIDAGAPKSMIGMDLALVIQEAIISETGEAQVEMDYTKKTKFTYAGGENCLSMGRLVRP
eukprot:1197642-Pyramimonas_sp.AAC.1